MANELLTDDVIAKEALMIVENNLTLTKLIDRRYEKKFAIEGKQIGDSLGIRLPVRWSGRDGEAMVEEDAKEQSVNLKIDKLVGQDLSFSNVDLTLKIEDFRKRYLDTAAASIANRIDSYVAAEYKNVPNFAGTPGTTPNSLDTYLDAGVILSNYGVPKGGDRSIVVSPRMEATLMSALKGLFQAAREIGEQYRTGSMGHVIGFDFYMDQNLKAHTIGPLGGTPLVNGASQSGASIITDGWTAAAANRLKKGDIVTFGGVNGVNPMPNDERVHEDTGELRQFVLTADVASDGSGNATLPIFPSIVLMGPYQNVTALPGDNAVIKIFGHASSYASVVSRQGLALHRQWLTAAFVDLELPGGMEMAARAKSNKLGLSIRIIKGYDIRSNKQLCRLDVLFGLKQLYEDFACRIAA